MHKKLHKFRICAKILIAKNLGDRTGREFFENKRKGEKTMKKNLVKKAAVALSMTAIISRQTLSVCAAPVNDFSAVGKDNLLRYYEENFDVAKFPFFDVQKYKSEYPDLQAVFGDDLSLYLNHGIFENRKSGGEIDIISVAKNIRISKLQQIWI